jgi:hypothetical protein
MDPMGKEHFLFLFLITSRAVDQCIRTFLILVDRLSYVPTRQSLPARSDQITPPACTDWRLGCKLWCSQKRGQSAEYRPACFFVENMHACMILSMASMARIPSGPRMGQMGLSAKSILGWRHVLANLPSGHATPQFSGCGLPRRVWWGTTEPGTPWGPGLMCQQNSTHSKNLSKLPKHTESGGMKLS